MSAIVHLGDCLEVMKTLESGSIDMILCDLPYGTTACKWDQVIPFAPLWEQYERLIKPNGAIVLTAAQPFTSALVMSNPRFYKYAWVWNKRKATGYLQAKLQPMRLTEDVLVFCKDTPPYYPQYTQGDPYKPRGGRAKEGVYNLPGSERAGSDGRRYPKNLLEIAFEKRPQHPTQKPVALFEYLIRTYTLPGETVLDNAAGSGTTGVAAIQCGRKAILIEQDAAYHAIAQRRVRHAQPALLGIG